MRRYIGIRFDTDVRIRIDFRDVFTVALLCCYEDKLSLLFVFFFRKGLECHTAFLAEGNRDCDVCIFEFHAILHEEKDYVRLYSQIKCAKTILKFIHVPNDE